MKVNYINNLCLCLHLDINSFLVFNKFLSLYFNLHIFYFKHKLRQTGTLFLEEYIEGVPKMYTHLLLNLY